MPVFRCINIHLWFLISITAGVDVDLLRFIGAKSVETPDDFVSLYTT